MLATNYSMYNSDAHVTKSCLLNVDVNLWCTVGMGSTQNFVHGIYHEKVARYRGTCFVIITKVKHTQQSNSRWKFVHDPSSLRQMNSVIHLCEF